MSLNVLPRIATAIIEVPRWNFVKYDGKGHIDFLSPLPSPFNYGAIPGTLAPDGEPIDAVVLGKRLSHGTEHTLPVLGIVKFIDDMLPDDKWILGHRLGRREQAALDAFFHAYALAKRAAGRKATVYLGLGLLPKLP